MQKKKQNGISKILLPLSLLIMLQTLPIYSETGAALSNDSVPKYGIDLNKRYTGQEVQELINIVLEEAEKSIAESYNAGYKQAVLSYKPEVEYWKAKALGVEAELKKQKIKSWLYCLGGVSIGFLGGMGIGFGMRLSY